MWELGETVTPSPHHPVGAKGVGESATVGSPAAVVNAVLDAIGVRHADMPLTPAQVWRACQGRPLRPDLAIGTSRSGTSHESRPARARGRAADAAHPVRAGDGRAGRAPDEREAGRLRRRHRRRHARRLRRRGMRGVHRARREPAAARGGGVRAAADHPGRGRGTRAGRRAHGRQPVPLRRHAGDLPGGDDPADAGGGVRGVAGGAGARAGGGGARLGRTGGPRPADAGHVGRGRRVARRAASSPSSARRWTPRWATSRWSRAAVAPRACSTSWAPPRASGPASTPRPGWTSAPGRRRRSRCRCAPGSSRPGRGSRGLPSRPPRRARGGDRPGLRDGGAGGATARCRQATCTSAAPAASRPGRHAAADDRARGAVDRHGLAGAQAGSRRRARRRPPGCRTPVRPPPRASLPRPSP